MDMILGIFVWKYGQASSVLGLRLTEIEGYLYEGGKFSQNNVLKPSEFGIWYSIPTCCC